jgi:hypothetical protein
MAKIRIRNSDLQIRMQYNIDGSRTLLLKYYFACGRLFSENMLLGSGGGENEGVFAEAEFLDVIGTKVLRVFLLAIPSHLH